MELSWLNFSHFFILHCSIFWKIIRIFYTVSIIIHKTRIYYLDIKLLQPNWTYFKDDKKIISSWFISVLLKEHIHYYNSCHIIHKRRGSRQYTWIMTTFCFQGNLISIKIMSLLGFSYTRNRLKGNFKMKSLSWCDSS